MNKDLKAGDIVGIDLTAIPDESGSVGLTAQDIRDIKNAMERCQNTFKIGYVAADKLYKYILSEISDISFMRRELTLLFSMESDKDVNSDF